MKSIIAAMMLVFAASASATEFVEPTVGFKSTKTRAEVKAEQAAFHKAHPFFNAETGEELHVKPAKLVMPAMPKWVDSLYFGD